jgi:hypothetical protein
MSKQEIILFTNTAGSTTFLIDEEGVVKMPTSQFKDIQLPSSATRIWSLLVDSPWAKDPLSYYVTDMYLS